MISFLVNAAFVMVFLFVFVLVGSLMLWIVVKVLRSLFPERFNPSTRRQQDEK